MTSGEISKTFFIKTAFRLAAGLMASSLAACTAPQQAGPPSASMAPAASAEPFQRQAYYVPARDGTQLALSVYRPVNAERVPTLLWIRPNRRESLDPRTGEILPAMSRDDIAFWTSHGYAIALAEMRGGGASFGTRDIDRSPQLGRDGADMVDWIARQPWSDGTLGMIGSSYQGFIQYSTAAHRPEALRAIFPEIAGFDDYGSMFHPGGIMNTALSGVASGSMASMAANAYDPERNLLPAVPVVDEDGDGELTDEIPLDMDGDGEFVDEAEPTYADGNPRKDIYLQATLGHLANTQLTVSELADASHRDSKIAGTDYTFADLDPGNRPAALAGSGIAVYNRGGWFDYHVRDSALWFATLKGHTPTKLMIAPTGHGGFPVADGEALYRAGPYFELFGLEDTQHDINAEKLRFFDYHLRGIDNGFADEAPVQIFVMGEGWRDEQEWPLARAIHTRLHFGPGGSLGQEPGADAQDSYKVDFTTTSTSNGASRWNYMISSAETPLSLDHDAQRRLSYQTAPLPADTEVTGHPVVELVLSSTAAEADVFVYLEDVAPDGSSLLVTEGQLRGNYLALRAIDGMMAQEGRSLGVRPDLPWQGFDAADYVPEPLADGAQVRLVFDLMPTSWVFREGHRIRLSLAGADADNFATHPGLQAMAEAGGAPTWFVHRGAAGSALVLPVIPASVEGETN